MIQIKMIRINKTRENKIRRLIPVAIAVLMVPLISPAQSAESSFERQVYLGFGVGSSSLSPVDIDGADIELTDDSSQSLQFYLGRDFTPRLTGELHYTRIADYKPLGQEDKGFTDISLSGLLYLTPSPQRMGLAGYMRLGIGEIKVQNTAGVYRDHPVHGMAGLGVEYAMTSGIAARAEYLYLDEDASVASMSLLYRIGYDGLRSDDLPELPEDPMPTSGQAPSLPPVPISSAPQALPDAVVEDTPVDSVEITEPVTTQTAELAIDDGVAQESPETSLNTLMSSGATTAFEAESESLAAESQDAMGETVIAEPSPLDTVYWQERDLTDTVYSSEAVAEQSVSIVSLDSLASNDCGVIACKVLSERFSGITFRIGSDVLTPQSNEILYGVVETMFDYPDLTLRLLSHTDNRGNAEKNLELSKLRAIAVYKYIVSRGVERSRVTARAFGGDRPIANNNKASGRRINRRVELVFSR